MNQDLSSTNGEEADRFPTSSLRVEMVYWPKESALSGTWQPPTVQPIN